MASNWATHLIGADEGVQRKVHEELDPPPPAEVQRRIHEELDSPHPTSLSIHDLTYFLLQILVVGS